MYQKFEIINTETDLFDRKIRVELSFDADESTVTKETIYVGERISGRILNFNINVVGNIIELDILEWPKPNTEYVLFVQKGIKSVSEENLDAALRRNLVFKSDITSVVDIINPSDNEKIKSLDISWTESTKEPGKQPAFSYYIEIASDNAFYNIEKTSNVIQKQNISLTDVVNGQHFLRIRVQKDSQYGKWSDVISFYFGNSPGTGDTGSQSSSSDSDQTAPILDINVLSAPKNGTTPDTAIFLFDQDINASSIKDLSVYSETDSVTIECTSAVNGRTLTITPATKFADNETYKIMIGSLASVSGNRILEDFVYTFATKMSPMYATVNDVNSLVSAFNIPDNQILYYINQASMMVDWLNSQSSTTSSTILKAPYDYEIVQFTKYKAAKDALLNQYVNKASTAGSKGQLLDISYEFSGGTTGIKDLLKEFDKEIMSWQEAIRGYGPEGRQKPLYAVKSSKSSPTTNSVSNLTGSYDRSTPMTGGF